MSTNFSMARDINGYNGFGVDFADDNYQVIMELNTEQTITVPDNYQEWLAIFSFQPGSSIWVAVNDTAEVPTTTLSTTKSQLNPTARRVRAGDVISMITGDSINEYAGVSLYVLR